MQRLAKDSTKIFVAIIEQLIKDGGEENAIKINNDKNYMALCVEKLHSVMIGGRKAQLYTFAHYYSQNGDPMRDPEMIFAYIDGRTEEYPIVESILIYPTYYRQDGLGIEQELVNYNEKGEATTFVRKLQRDATTFANQWMRNIKDQQYITPATIPDMVTVLAKKNSAIKKVV